jgi:hypothetical protein
MPEKTLFKPSWVRTVEKILPLATVIVFVILVVIALNSNLSTSSFKASEFFATAESPLLTTPAELGSSGDINSLPTGLVGGF